MLRKLYYLLIILSIYHSAYASLLVSGLPSTSRNIVVVASSGQKTTINILPLFAETKKQLISIIPINNHILSIETLTPQPIQNIYSYSSVRKNLISKKHLNSTYQTISDFVAEGQYLPENLTYSKSDLQILDLEQTVSLLQEYNVKDSFCSNLKNQYGENFKFVVSTKKDGVISNSLRPIKIVLENNDKNIQLFGIEKNSNIIFLTKSGQPTPCPTNKDLSLIYSWPIYSCKPCVNPIPTMQELYKLGVTWYHKPKKGMMGLISPSAMIYVTNYLYNGKSSDLIFKKSKSRKEFQLFSGNYK